jgi:hypothetical protein
MCIGYYRVCCIIFQFTDKLTIYGQRNPASGLKELPFSILIQSSPKVMLLAVDLHKDFIDAKGIAAATVFSF